MSLLILAGSPAANGAPFRKKVNRLPVLFILGLTTAVPAPLSAQDIFAGRSVYEEHCARCHGPDGMATVPGVPNFSDGMGLYASDTDLIRLIKHGKGVMPGYDLVLKESEILNVVSYLRTIRR